MGFAHPPALDMLGVRGVSPLALPEVRGLCPLTDPPWGLNSSSERVWWDVHRDLS